MTEEHFDRAPLPAARALTPAAQRRVLALVVLGVVVVVVLILAGRRASESGPAASTAAPAGDGSFRPTKQQLAQIKIQPARSGAVAEIVRATGAIGVDADHSTPVVLPFSGQVQAVMVEAGQHVRRGQPLLRIASSDVVDARNALLAATSGEASAAEAVRIASANAQRQRLIVETAGGAQKDFQQAQADLVTAQANLRTAQASVRAAGNKLALFGEGGVPPATTAQGGSGAIYRAPTAGVIADRSVAPGQFIAAGGNTALMTITDLSQVWLIAQLAESDAASVHLGDQVTVTTPALPGRSFNARIDNIAASLDPQTHRLPVRATVSNPGGELKPQMFASFVIRRVLAGGAGVLVPAEAVIHEGDNARLWVMRADGALVSRTVQTGATEGGFTRILSGLSAGERVVTGGALFVNEAGLNG